MHTRFRLGQFIPSPPPRNICLHETSFGTYPHVCCLPLLPLPFTCTVTLLPVPLPRPVHCLDICLGCLLLQLQCLHASLSLPGTSLPCHAAADRLHCTLPTQDPYTFSPLPVPLTAGYVSTLRATLTLPLVYFAYTHTLTLIYPLQDPIYPHILGEGPVGAIGRDFPHSQDLIPLPLPHSHLTAPLPISEDCTWDHPTVLPFASFHCLSLTHGRPHHPDRTPHRTVPQCPCHLTPPRTPLALPQLLFAYSYRGHYL